MKTLALILSVFFLGGMLFSCRSTKKIQTAIAKKDTATVTVVPDSGRPDSAAIVRSIYQRIDSAKIRFNTFSAKLKVDYEDNEGKTRDFNAFIRIKCDSMIWISINAALGIEAFRVLITPDSVKLLNKLDRVVQLRSMDYLQEVAKLPFDFNTLQQLIIGNPIYFNEHIVSYSTNGTEMSLVSVSDLFKHLITINTNDLSIQHSKLDDVDLSRNRTCDLTYNDYEFKNGIRFSQDRRITVAEKSRLNIDLKFKQYNFNETLTYPFTIPKNYKRN